MEVTAALLLMREAKRSGGCRHHTEVAPGSYRQQEDYWWEPGFPGRTPRSGEAPIGARLSHRTPASSLIKGYTVSHRLPIEHFCRSTLSKNAALIHTETERNERRRGAA